MKLKEIMTKDVATLTEEGTIEDAADIMKQYDVGAVPVCSEQKIIGIITDRDIAVRSIAEGKDYKNIRAREIMTSNPVLGTPDMDVSEAATIMSKKQIRRLPVVVNNTKTLVGIVSLGDMAVEPKYEEECGVVLSNISEPCIPSM